MSEVILRVDALDPGKTWRVEIEDQRGRVFDRCVALADADLAAIPDLAAAHRTWRGFVAGLAPGGAFRPTPENLKAVGQLVRERIFSNNKVEQRIESIQDLIEGRERLRVAIEVDESDPALAVVPMELAWQPSAFVFKSDDRAVFRVLPSCSKANLRIGRGSRVLIATAHADDIPPLPAELAAHAEKIEAALQAAGFEVEILADATADSLFERLGAAPGFDLLYLVAHGVEDAGKGGLLVLRGKSLSGDELSKRLLAVGRRRKTLQAVVFCSCGSALAEHGTLGLAQRLVLPASDSDARPAALATIGFRAPVGVGFALRFFERLFASLGREGSLEDAFAEARFQEEDSEPQWVLPLLYSRHPLPEVAPSLEGDPMRGPTTRGERPREFDLELGRLPGGLPLELRRASAHRSGLPRQPRPDFVDRVQALDDLREWLGPKRSPSRLAIQGVAGVGKTELALQFARETEEEWGRLGHGLVVWLDLSGLAVRDALFEILELAGVRLPEGDLTTGELSVSVQETLGAQRGLLILDDLEDPELASILTPGPRWKVLATTRYAGLLGQAVEIGLDPLDWHDAIEMLSRIVWGLDEPPAEGWKERNAVEGIIDRFGGLPLALQVAGSTIRRESKSAAEYFASFARGPFPGEEKGLEEIFLRALRSMDQDDERTLLALANLPSRGVTLGALAAATDVGVLPASRRVERLVKNGLVAFSPERGRYGLHGRLRELVQRRLGSAPLPPPAPASEPSSAAEA